MNTMTNPSWWNDTHTSGFDRMKEALKRDWEQTKADFSRTKGKDLNQGAGDTVKQAVGKEALPPINQPNPSDEWTRVEPAYRYGYGASTQYGMHKQWDSTLEGKLKTEWTDLKSGRTWEEMKDSVKRGWNAGRTPAR